MLELPDDGRAAPVRAVLLARLEVLGWELAEADRKQGWALRYRRGGPEATAWLRASALVDGRVFLGGPATGLAPAAPDRRDRDRQRSLGPPPVPVRGPAPLKHADPRG